MSKATENRPRRPRGRALLGAAVAGLLLAALPTADAMSTTTSNEASVFADARNGLDAIASLGAQLPEIAARAGLDPAELRHRFETDSTLYVLADGTLVHRDTGLVAPDDLVQVQIPESYSAGTNVFALHSKRGASKTIYLDFNGHRVEDTTWNSGSKGFTATAFSLDSNTRSFSSQERSIVYAVWNQVAEDFAPWDVDVTTQSPAFEKINRSSYIDDIYGTRVVISGTNTIYRDCGCGGIASLGAFNQGLPSVQSKELDRNVQPVFSHAYHQPAFVFTRGTGPGAKGIAEAASHEAGHTLGLLHDGKGSAEYYNGHGNWAPIMGAGYSRRVTQWSSGEYNGATNRQDDLTVMEQYGLTRRADDHGNTRGTARVVSPGQQKAGIISDPTDRDYFKVKVGTGTSRFFVRNVSLAPNVDLGVVVRNSKGQKVIQSGGRADEMYASVDVYLHAGTYYLEVVGTGSLDPLFNGYSNYGSIGQYVLDLSGVRR